VDEGTYHLMAKNLADGYGFEIWNGYQEYPSRELISGSLVIAKDRLVAMPPELFTLVALPFYMLFGYRGLFFLNAVAFLGVLALTYLIARRFFGDGKLATSACFILALSTYMWNYSQAAWPHVTSTLFIMAAFYAMVRAFCSKNNLREMICWGLLAGLLGGLAPGIRLDATFAIPALLLPLLFTRPAKWAAFIAAGLGLLPGLITLSLLNNHKFGTFSPFSYGREGASSTSGLLPYLPLVITGFLVLLAVRVLSRSSILEYFRQKRTLAVAIMAACGVGLICIPQVYAVLERLAAGAAQLLIDLRYRSLDLVEPGMSRTPTGGIIYIGGLKKSLLQSCPYIAALLIPVVHLLRRGRDAKAIALLLFPPACFIGVYSYFAWHGGQCLNLRYLIPTLPFVAILAAYAWKELTHSLNRRWWLIGFVAFGIAVLALTVRLNRENLMGGNHETYILSLPLFLGSVLAALSVMVMLDGQWQFASNRITGLRTSAAVFCLAAMVWAGCVAFFYDYPIERTRRKYNHDVASLLGPIISDDSIVFTNTPDPFFGLTEHSAVRIAVPVRDRYKDFRRLVNWHLDQDRPVYASFRDRTWQFLLDQGHFGDWIIQDLTEGGFLSQIKKSER
jgi:4-amino-4-deoxy-L-arabinose transferase-like glycosyltransferase